MGNYNSAMGSVKTDYRSNCSDLFIKMVKNNLTPRRKDTKTQRLSRKTYALGLEKTAKAATAN